MKIPRPRHATIVAYLALFAALGGSAYAVSKIDSGETKDRSIKGQDVANNTLGGRQINEVAVGQTSACATANVQISKAKTFVAIGFGSQSGAGGAPGRASCRLELGTGEIGNDVVVGTDGDEANGFTVATAAITRGGKGLRPVNLVCRGENGTTQITNAGVAVLGLR